MTKKTFSILLTVLLLISCGRKKPFVITGKDLIGSGYARFTYQDASGTGTSFHDLIGKYNIGDTIK